MNISLDFILIYTYHTCSCGTLTYGRRTMDVLGLRARLETRRKQLADGTRLPESELVAKADDQPVVENQAFVKSRLNRRDLEELGEIDRALFRIKAGIYGRCAECGKKIGESRLNAIPEAETCITHARDKSLPDHRIPGMQDHSTTDYQRV